MSEKKMVRRSVAIALGIICILLIALIAYFSITGISAQNSYDNLQNQNQQLHSWLDGNETLLNQTQAGNTNLQNQNTNLTNQVNDLNSTVNDLNRVVNLEKTQHWEGGEEIYYNASSYHEWGSNADYAGYLEVDVQSNASSTYVQVAYYSYGVHYDNQVVVGAGSTRTYFPILPTLEVTTRVGNTSLFDGALIGVTIIYHY